MNLINNSQSLPLGSGAVTANCSQDDIRNQCRMVRTHHRGWMVSFWSWERLVQYESIYASHLRDYFYASVLTATCSCKNAEHDGSGEGILPWLDEMPSYAGAVGSRSSPRFFTSSNLTGPPLRSAWEGWKI
jgi:hypothetical protein